VTLATMSAVIDGSDGVIVGSALKDSNGYDARVDPRTAAQFGRIRQQVLSARHGAAV